LQKIPIAGPWITQREIDYVTDAVTNGWYANASVYNERFEKAFAEYLGVRFAISLPSCTSALHLSLLALKVGAGDDVIVPDITWIASSAPISYVGASPIFADVDEKTWCISTESFEQSITSKTKAAIIVDLYGNMPDMNAICEIASQNDIILIEDAAEAIGSEFKHKKAGSFGDVGAFSFHGSKTLTTGEGGMLVTNNEDVDRRCLFLRDHGRDESGKMFWNTEVGYKYKMSSMQAALGLAQLERIQELVDRKRQIFSYYKSELKNVEGIALNYETQNTKNTYWMVTVILDRKYSVKKEELVHRLAERGIDSRPFFYPLSSLPAYSALKTAAEAQKRNRNAYAIAPYGINLPSGMNMTKELITYVCDGLKEIVNGP
jgi:perosamine synthetase